MVLIRLSLWPEPNEKVGAGLNDVATEDESKTCGRIALSLRGWRSFADQRYATLLGMWVDEHGLEHCDVIERRGPERVLPRGDTPDVMNHGDLIPPNVLTADDHLTRILDVSGFKAAAAPSNESGPTSTSSSAGFSPSETGSNRPQVFRT
ncbi:hypothetical protein KL864_34190 [Mycolicibacterium goodii]|uniref:hypothetical protein n=1 Tax=Mycolicibacterium goodii TaxID=134601 RepID=UPI001BDC4B2F|nr:hypothetical protein [Mycolicibacterium goodii]MBU8820916.1 hypothetical protein [Mycolicibacterium goodii]